MATILVIGSQEIAAELASFLRSEHSLSVLDIETDDDSTSERVLGERGARQAAVDAVFDLTAGDSAQKERALRAAAAVAGESTVIFTNAIMSTATSSQSLLAPGCTLVGIAMVPALTASAAALEASIPLQCDSGRAGRAIELLRGLITKRVEVVEDRVGLVSARVLAMVVNEAAFALMEGVADAKSIDTAMKLGTGYPEGPLRWAETIGPCFFVSLLDALYREYREERYRPCVLLRQLALAGRPFHS